jgi:predicted nucleic acid-binding protein
MTLIVDASVALKWVIEELGSTEAMSLIATEALAAPDFLFVECANVLRTKTRRGQITAAEASMALTSIEATPIRVLAVKPLVATALVIATELVQSAYDSLYLAAALAERATLVTADEAFAQAALTHPAYARAVRRLGPTT